MEWLIKLRNETGLNKLVQFELTKDYAEELVTMIESNRNLYEDEITWYEECFNKNDFSYILAQPIIIDYDNLTLLKGLQILNGFIASYWEVYHPFIIFQTLKGLNFIDVGQTRKNQPKYEQVQNNNRRNYDNNTGPGRQKPKKRGKAGKRAGTKNVAKNQSRKKN